MKLVTTLIAAIFAFSSLAFAEEAMSTSAPQGQSAKTVVKKAKKKHAKKKKHRKHGKKNAEAESVPAAPAAAPAEPGAAAPAQGN